MMQDSLARALGGLKGTRMDDVAADHVRRRLELGWVERAARRRPRFAVPGFARAFAAASLAVLVAMTTMHAAADNPLYGARVVVEDSLVAFQSDPVGYLSQLYAERLEEAARFEATGNVLAASRARSAQSEALRLLNQISPPEPEQSPEPSASTSITLPAPTASPETTAVATGSPTPEPTATPRPPVRTATPTVKPATPKPTATPTPTPTPRPTTTTPTPTPMDVHAYGYVLYADGSAVDGACVSTSLDGTCVAGSIQGRVDLRFSAKKGQSITLYFRNYDASRGGTLHGKVTVTVGGPEVALGTITLR